jgi:predicted aspartyl protease
MITLDGAGLKTLSGERSVQRVVIDVIDVGEIRLRNQVAVVIADVEPDATLADGLLPLHLFARVTFNGPQKMLIVEAR